MPKSLNQAALEIIQPILDDPPRYGARVDRSKDGARIIDMGVDVKGSWQGAKLWVHANHGGMAELTYGRMQVKGLDLPLAQVMVDDPMLSVLGCAAGAWKVGEGELALIASGPARAKARADRRAQMVEYQDPSENVLLQLQAGRLPEDEVVRFVADACHIPVRNLTVMVAPSGSLVGSVQVAARSVELCMISLARNTRFDLQTIRHGYGSAPIAPVIEEETLAVGRINDALVYGGTAGLFVHHPDDQEVEQAVRTLPFSALAGQDYGKGYAEFFEAYDRDPFQIPARLDSPARVIMANLPTGSVFAAGEINEDRLYASFTQQVGR